MAADQSACNNRLRSNVSENRDFKDKLAKHLHVYYLPTLLIISLIVLFLIISVHPTTVPFAEIQHESLLIRIAGYAVIGCEIAAVIVISIAAIYALLSFLKRIFDRNLPNQIKSSETLRLRMGHQMSLGLEFAVAADILRLAVSPTFADIIRLFVVILLRVLLNYFLEHDIQTIREYYIIPELEEPQVHDHQ